MISKQIPLVDTLRCHAEDLHSEHGHNKSARLLSTGADEIDRLRAELTEARKNAEQRKWLPIETAPTDGTSVLLLVMDGDYPLNDCNPCVSIGSYGTEGGPEYDPTWCFAGWHWCQDLYVRGNGTPTHWMPLPAVDALMADLEERK